jgi:cell wall-associated NlpC family hydrolase
MVIDDFEGRVFDWETANCYTLVRDFYKRNYDIALADYACPRNWWLHGLDLYRILAPQEGFHLVDASPTDWQAGDVVLMAIDSPLGVGNHIGVLLPDGRLLHHLVGCLSRATQYGGLFRNNHLAIYRHPEVRGKSTGTQTSNVLEYLSPHARRKLEHRLEEHRARSQAQEEVQTGG